MYYVFNVQLLPLTCSFYLCFLVDDVFFGMIEDLIPGMVSLWEGAIVQDKPPWVHLDLSPKFGLKLMEPSLFSF